MRPKLCDKREPYLKGNRFMVAIILFLLVAIPVNGLIWFLAHNDYKTQNALIVSEASSNIEKLRIRIGTNFKHIVTDLIFFANYHELHATLESPIHEPHLIQDFSLFSQGSKLYDQIRYINNDGMEHIRINITEEGIPIIVPKDKLQDKSKRYYFTDAIKLTRDEVFISPFDLNIEHGKVENPYKPMIRFATPVFNDNNSKRGILAFNYLGKFLIQDIKDVSATNLGVVMLLNSQGYWIIGRTPDEQWGFMFDDKQDVKFGQAYPMEWEELLKDKEGQFFSDKGLFTFVTIFPLLESWKSSSGVSKAFEPSISLEDAMQYNWKAVSLIPSSYITKMRNDAFRKYIYLSIIVSIIMAASAWRISRENILKAIIADKTLMLQEIHHRVRNNLQILSSINSIQSSNIKDNKEALKILNDNQGRIRTMSIIQESLYCNSNISKIDTREYFESIVRKCFAAKNIDTDKITYAVSIEKFSIHIDKMSACGMIVNELIENALMYAFKDGTGMISVCMRLLSDDIVELEVRDNGIGLHESIDIESGKTVGLLMVDSLVHQIDGNVVIRRDGGTDIQVTFPRR